MSKEIIWLVAHYPDHAEMDERIHKAVALHRKTQFPIWVFASSTTQYPERVELLIQKKLLTHEIDPKSIFISEYFGSPDTLDTVQEIHNVFHNAQKHGVERVHCVSNRLQLLQIHGLTRKHKVQRNYVSTTLKDRRWWYVGTRFALIPLAFLGIGKNFPPLQLVRHARSRWTGWNI